MPCASSWAGACTEGGDGYYVSRIEKLAKAKRPPSTRGDDPFYCLDIRFGMTNRWAGPRAAAKIKRLRRSKLRKRIQRACSRGIAKARSSLDAQPWVRLLAAYGIREINGTTTYQLASKHFKFGLAFSHLAALGDPKAVPELLRRFYETRACRQYRDGRKAKSSCIDFERGKKNRWTRKAHREHKISVLNALWHLAPATSLAFLMKVASGDADALVRQRAKRVIKRLQELGASVGRAKRLEIPIPAALGSSRTR